MPLLPIGSTSQNTCFMVYLPSRGLKPAYRASRCVTGLRDGRPETLVGIGLGYPPCFARKSRESAEYCGWIKGFPCQKPENALKPLFLVKSALARGISFSEMQEKSIQKTRASSITIRTFAPCSFLIFSGSFRGIGWQNMEHWKNLVPPSHPPWLYWLFGEKRLCPT